MGFGLKDLEDNIRVRPEFPCVVDNLDTRFAVSRIAELRARSGAGFNTYIETQLLDTPRRFRGQRDALLTRMDFLWNTDFHLFLFPHQRRHPVGVTRLDHDSTDLTDRLRGTRDATLYGWSLL